MDRQYDRAMPRILFGISRRVRSVRSQLVRCFDPKANLTTAHIHDREADDAVLLVGDGTPRPAARSSFRNPQA